MTSILIVGVGGQGTLLASRILGSVAIRAGFDVKVSEVHGMSQRGGSVETYVRFSKGKVDSPIIDYGCADIVIAFELLEAARSVRYLKKSAALIVNTQQLNPMPVIAGLAAYPEGLLEELQMKAANMTAVNALDLAIASGSAKTVNVVLIGVLAASMDIAKKDWLDTIREIAPEKMLTANLKAFEAGYCAAS
ncbi:MAG: indolepyruvate oxidoreductase subunit beta [Clostridiales bacterium]|jgi:indolepyruvate ferredoxin oxidoreductase beta subunit|nr:indolepyruvate oxidoreductase subunit beta [Clostridiales bacterium]